MEALYDEDSGLTYPALTGVRKQSIAEVERVFREKIVSFMKQKAYEAEAHYVSVVRNWRRAVDERGLSGTQRQQDKAKMLQLILDDLMPWHREDELINFSSLEVNKCKLYALMAKWQATCTNALHITT